MDNDNSTSIDAGKPPRPSTNPATPTHDSDKDHISTVLLELGQATALVDLLFMVASDSDVESLQEDTLTNSLHAVMERLRAAKVAADAILDDWRPVAA
jgi:hypothetical protein